MTTLNLYPAYPEIFLVSTICVILVLDLFISDAKRVITYLLTQLALLGTIVILVMTTQSTITLTFHDMFVDDFMADIDGGAVFLERQLDDVDRTHDASAKAPWLR